MREFDFYPDVKVWLSAYLASHYRTAQIIVEDTHDIKLSNFIFRKKLTNKFPQYKVFDIKTDVTGIINKRNGVSELVFVEFKVTKITLNNVGQLLGYSLVAHPLLSFLMSPAGISQTLFNLFYRYKRLDILQYSKNKKIQIIPWGVSRKAPMWKDKI